MAAPKFPKLAGLMNEAEADSQPANITSSR